MSGRIGLLSALLALQLVIIAAVLLMESGAGAPAQGPFLDFESAAVDEIRINGEEGDAVVLTRGDDSWRLGDGLPADGAKVDEVLATLSGLGSPWPVATSSGAAARFEVTDDEYQRHVVLSGGGEVLADLYLGTSPGYQQVHARRAGEDAVYSVAVSNYQLPAAADQWLDKAMLQPRGPVAAVERHGAWRLDRSGEAWQLSSQGEGGADAGVAADPEAAGDFVRRLSELRITGVAQAPPQDAEPAAVLAVTDEDGSYRLTLFEGGEGADYTLGSSRREGWFSLAGYLAEQLLTDREDLLPEPEVPEPEADPDAAGTGETP